MQRRREMSNIGEKSASVGGLYFSATVVWQVDENFSREVGIYVSIPGVGVEGPSGLKGGVKVSLRPLENVKVSILTCLV